MTRLRQYFFFSLLLIFISCGTTQPADQAEQRQDEPSVYNIERPLPYPIDIPNAFRNAQQFQTRTQDGYPGEDYWQNEGTYKLHAELIPENHMLHGSSEVEYFNNSPDPLNVIVVELAQNLHKEGTPKKDVTEITGGVQMEQVLLNGEKLAETSMQARWTNRNAGYVIEGTRMYLFPSEPVPSDSSAELEFKWSFEIPMQGASGRMGRSRENLYMLAYWYPHISVYDDVYGWMDDSFLGNAEFYHKFSDYEISVTAPREWIVMSTGDFLNPEETLSETAFERYVQAGESDEVVTIADFNQLENATATSDDGKLTWKFSADRIRDVAFSATRESKWDGVRAAVGDLDGDGETDYTRINTFYRESASLWNEQTDYAQHSVTFLSDYTGIPYPWPHMTSVEGAEIIGGGMEFPMITIIGDYNNLGGVRLYGVTAHEIAHMWVPMIVSTNERRYTWIDEGHTSFHTQKANVDRYSHERFSRGNLFAPYLRIAGTDFEGEMMRWSDFHYPGPAYGVASYPKPASVLTALQGVLGDELFESAHREFMKRWEYKHPYPWDFFNTIEDVAERDLNWFWRSWYYEKWTLDQTISDVSTTGNVTTVVIEDLGNIPMPVLLQLTLENGTIVDTTLDVNDWLEGRRKLEFTIETESHVEEVMIDPDHYFPDTNRSNNRWERSDTQ